MKNLLQALVAPRAIKERSFLAELRAPWTIRDSIMTAVFAALYIGVTMAIAPIAYGIFQIRISEALGMIAFDGKYGGRPAAIGVPLGGVIVALFSPFMGIDIVIGLGSGVICTWFAWWAGCQFKGSDLGKIVAGLEYTFVTVFFIGYLLLSRIFGMPAMPAMTGVMIGELISALALGFILLKVLERTYRDRKRL